MLHTDQALQIETDNGVIVEIDLSNKFVDDSPFADMRLSVATSNQSDWDELDIYTSWKEQANDRYGAGSPAPCIPHSQRLYDGDNHGDYCEVWVG